MWKLEFLRVHYLTFYKDPENYKEIDADTLVTSEPFTISTELVCPENSAADFPCGRGKAIYDWFGNLGNCECDEGYEFNEKCCVPMKITGSISKNHQN